MGSGYPSTVKSLCTVVWLLGQDTPRGTVFLLMQDLNYPMVNMIVHFRLYIQFFLYKLSPLLDSIFDFELDVQHVHCKYQSYLIT